MEEYDSEYENDVKSPFAETEDKMAHLSNKGKMMARIIAEYIMMKYFFPNLKDLSR